MSHFLGIDLGTQSVKVIAYNEKGELKALSTREYPIISKQPGFAEQEPETWWEKTTEAIREVLLHLPSREIKGIGFSGQMHGAVFLDENLKPIYPAIIWADQRSKKQVALIRETLKKDLAEISGSTIATGFMAASVLWLKENLPQIYDKIRWIILPKDYLKVKMGLPPSTDVADASATLLFNIKRRKWSEKILDVLDINPDLLPPVYNSSEVIGEMAHTVKENLGLKGEGILVAGAGDQHCAALGNGIIHERETLLTIGTGGQIFTPLTRPRIDPKLRIHTFCHAVPGYWHLLGATLCAGLSLSWFKKSLLDSPSFSFDFKEMDEEARKIPPGCNELLFLPYLLGERTPYMDPSARGAFVNLHLTHQRAHFTRAIMEGVALSLKNAWEVFEELGVESERFVFSGGGSKSSLWRKILASVFREPLFTTTTREEAATGACILAMVGTGCFSNFEEAVNAMITYHTPTLPEPEWSEKYGLLFEKFKRLYDSLKEHFPKESG
ncbi:xylulokinase [Thermatribacter velox]|uniref:Xylulose kinase n=1 Tax=Thermatribacter velox TaxID=3039681 RepID=A0ABZ2YDY1_9BACT